MNNQHAGLSQTLANQHITGLRDHATRQRLKLAANRAAGARRRPATGGNCSTASRRRGPANQSPAQRQSIDRRQPCPNSHAHSSSGHAGSDDLAGLTAVAHAPDGKQGRRPATERQVGETWREPPLTAQQPAAANAALQRVLSRERFSVSTGRPGR